MTCGKFFCHSISLIATKEQHIFICIISINLTSNTPLIKDMDSKKEISEMMGRILPPVTADADEDK